VRAAPDLAHTMGGETAMEQAEKRDPEDLEPILEVALELARDAGRTTLSYFQSGLAAEWKTDRSPVTEADRAAERILRSGIADRFPGDGILGEEYGAERLEAPRRWILDPIDGTRSFLRGVPLFGVLVALEEGDDVLLGILHFPALEETVWAARGLGCWWNGRRARVSPVDRVEDAAVLVTDGAWRPEAGPPGARGWEDLRSRAGLVRTWGDCYGHALVATGRAEAMLDPVAAVWDAAPLRPVIEEAGGVFTALDGRRTHRGGSALSTSAALAVEVRRILGAGLS
jgi:histidinol phosphatase-like enzyme (inositol monophosphatase family)